MSEIVDFCEREKTVKPSTVLQLAAGLSGKAWAHWQNGGECRMTTAQKIRDWMAARDEKREAKEHKDISSK